MANQQNPNAQGQEQQEQEPVQISLQDRCSVS